MPTRRGTSVLRDALPTGGFLIASRQEITNKCYFCNQNSENFDHIFKYYHFV